MEVIVYRWNGQGWYPNVPARDLTQADIDNIDPEAWAIALALGLYEVV